MWCLSVNYMLHNKRMKKTKKHRQSYRHADPTAAGSAAA